VKLSIVIPALDEEARLPETLASLAPLRAQGHEVIVVDGGSRDRSADLARPLADRVIVAPRGRARQMNAGATLASGDALVFLHADTRLPPEAEGAIAAALARTPWGRFDLALDSSRPLLRVVAALVNLRSRATGIATGDQAIFVRREVFVRLGGYPDLPLMEDIALSRRLRRVAWPACLRARVVSSARRWERQGAWRTILLMWRLRAAFALGVPAERLARRYRDVR